MLHNIQLYYKKISLLVLKAENYLIMNEFIIFIMLWLLYIILSILFVLSIYYDFAFAVMPDMYTEGIINVLYLDEPVKDNIQNYVEFKSNECANCNNPVVRFINLFNGDNYINPVEKEEFKNTFYIKNQINPGQTNWPKSRILYFVDCVSYHLDKLQSK